MLPNKLVELVVVVAATILPNVGAVFDWPNVGAENPPKLGVDCVVAGVPKIDGFCSAGLFAPNVNALAAVPAGFGFIVFVVPNGEAAAAATVFLRFGDPNVGD